MKKSTNTDHQKYIVDYHNEFLEGSTGFSEHGSDKRYEEIYNIIHDKCVPNDPFDILEVGCGPSQGFYRYCGSDIRGYTGIDLNADYIVKSNAAPLNSIAAGAFLRKDIYDMPISEHYDVVIGSGIFCYNYPLAEIRNAEMFSRMADIAKKLVIVNFIPSDTPNRQAIVENNILTYNLEMIQFMIDSVTEKGWYYDVIRSSYENNMTLILTKGCRADFDKEWDER